MKKFLIYIFLISLISILAACSSNSDESNLVDNMNLINPDKVIEGSWVDGKAEIRSNSDMFMTEKIAYNANESYSLSRNAYVSFYKDEEFLKTVRYQGGFSDFPFTLETVDKSNNLIISFNKKWLDEIELTNK